MRCPPTLRHAGRRAERLRVRRQLRAAPVHADGALRLGVRAHLPEQPVGAEPAKYHLWPATAQRRQHGRHSGLSECLRSQDRHSARAAQPSGRRFDRGGVGLGTAGRRSGALGAESRRDVAAAVRRVPPGVGPAVGPNRQPRAGRGGVVLRQALHDVLLPHEAARVGVL
uniref:(northern house mosquito) hypothetical protein n=1 Tax=Culex pipiens TaxID=7175 RepID=A0A8D8CI42_CULPI